ncbi:MAG: hypothetical protein ACRDF7_06260 [Candidatus Limnocylindrales bacterium]
MPARKGATNGAASTDMTTTDLPTTSDMSEGGAMSPTAEESMARMPALEGDPSSQVVRADRLDLRQAAVRSAEALELNITQGAAGMARADRVSVVQGALGVAVADSVDVRQGVARVVIARGPVHVDQGFARTVVAQDVELGDRAFAGLVIARDVRGGRVLLDWRGGLALGGVLAVAWALLRGRRR